MNVEEACAKVDAWTADQNFGVHEIGRTLRQALAEAQAETERQRQQKQDARRAVFRAMHNEAAVITERDALRRKLATATAMLGKIEQALAEDTNALDHPCCGWGPLYAEVKATLAALEADPT